MMLNWVCFVLFFPDAVRVFAGLWVGSNAVDLNTKYFYEQFCYFDLLRVLTAQ